MTTKQPDCVISLDDQTRGIARKLGEGIPPRFLPGDPAIPSIVRIAPHSEGTLHSHPQEQWGVLLEGALVRSQGGEEVAMKAGNFWCTPGGVEHSVRTGDEGALVLDVFAPPRDEYRKAGEGFGV